MNLSFHSTRRFVLRAGVAGVAAALLAACQPKKLAFNSTDVSGSEIGQDLSLTDHNGQARTLQDFKGKVLVVFFGFVQCPDVCPTTLAEFVQVRNELGKDADRVQVVFVTVDPERDTADVLRQYVTQFDPSFIGLRGDAEETARVAKSFKVFYAKVPGKEADSYTMDHTAGVYIYDPEGQLRLFARHNAGVQALSSDIKQLL